MIREQYNFYVNYHANHIARYSNLLHSLYDKKNILYNLISGHKDYLHYIGFPVERLNEVQNEERLDYFNIYFDFDETPEHLTLRANVQTYVYTSTKTIPAIKAKIEYHTYMLSIPYEFFKESMYAINTEISSHLLKGRAYDFPKRIGGLKVVRFDRDFNKKIVDFGNTIKERKKGNNVTVYHMDDEYVGLHYDKNSAIIPNYKFYKFSFTSYIHVCNRQKLEYYDSIEDDQRDIYDNDKVGNLQKMLALIHLYGKLIFDKYGV